MVSHKFNFQEQKNNRNGEAYSMFIEEKKGAYVNNEEKGVAIARAIQKNDLSKNDFSNEFFQLNSLFLQSDCMSGDFFEYIKIDENRTGILVADIVGKGVEVGLSFQIFKNTVQGINKNQPMGEFLFELNNKLIANTEVVQGFSFVFYCVLDSQKMSLEYAHCGISLARLFRENEAINLDKYGGFPLGAVENERFTSGVISLQKNDKLLIATNGLDTLKEASSAILDDGWVNVFFSENNSPLSEIETFCDREIKENGPLKDDIVCVLLDINESDYMSKYILSGRREINKPPVYEYQIIHRSKNIQNALSKAKYLVDTGLDISVHGEPGVGKELFPSAIKEMSKRSSLEVVDCGEKYNHEIFLGMLKGTRKGQYTDAENKKGLIEEFDGGVLHWDELQEMSLQLQSSILRFIENRTYKNSDNQWIKSDILNVFTFNKDINLLVKKELFRADLRDRIFIPDTLIKILPLRSRKEDIEPIVEEILWSHNKKYIEEAAIKKLLNYDWPGNVRELIKKMIVVCKTSNSDIIFSDDIQLNHHSKSIVNEAIIDAYVENTSIRKVEKRKGEIKFLKLLNKNKMDVKKTADQLNMSLSTGYRIAKKFKIN